MELERGLTPALFAYEGIQYQHMAPTVFTDAEYAYVQEHLRILSGFYGMLRPFDGIVPYRLEMQAKPEFCGTLYRFWGQRLGTALSEQNDLVIDLASEEYSRHPAELYTKRCEDEGLGNRMPHQCRKLRHFENAPRPRRSIRPF